MKKNLVRIGLLAAMLLIVFAFAAPKASADETAHRHGRYYGPPPAVYRHHHGNYHHSNYHPRAYHYEHYRHECHPRPYCPYDAPYERHYRHRPVVVAPSIPYARPVIGVYF